MITACTKPHVLVILLVSFALCLSVKADEVPAYELPDINSVALEILSHSELYGRDGEYLIEGFVGTTKATSRVRVTTGAGPVF